MPRDTLATLIRVRRLACEEALRQLATALAEEDRSAQAVQAAERVIAQELEGASAVEGSDAQVEAFAVWLPGARRRLEAARQHLTARQAETARARAELTICKTALETVETLRAQRRDAAEATKQRRAERELMERPGRNDDAGEM